MALIINDYRVNAIVAEIERLEHEKIKMLEVIFHENFKKVTWDFLEKYLITYPRSYGDNPMVGYFCKNFYGVTEANYCQIKEGKLQVGPYRETDGYPIGKDIYVNFKKSWRGDNIYDKSHIIDTIYMNLQKPQSNKCKTCDKDRHPMTTHGPIYMIRDSVSIVTK